MHESRGELSLLVRGVDALRKKLLDLTMRNRMLNFRPSKKYGLNVEGEGSLQVYDALVERGRKMSFQGMPDVPRSGRSHEDAGEAANPESEDKPAAKGNGRTSERARQVAKDDLVLHVPMPESVVQAKLRLTHRQEHLAREELGVHTLFLTFGMLEWFEAESSKGMLLSPLVFVPVELEKTRVGTFKLLYEGGEVGDNLPLQAKLKEQNIHLPEFDLETGLETYFREVEATIRSRPGWNVRRDDIQLGFFSYEKYAMYMDLGGEHWPEDRKPWHNPDIGALLGNGYTEVQTAAGDDTFLDDLQSVVESHEVLDADSSQRVALIRASEGLSMVVEGPPGTGKSQTITNLIAEAVHDGRTVLFVSAKKAALDVVARKLSEVGLADSLIDLHDKAVTRSAFYTEIKRTLEQHNKYRNLDEQVRRLGELRDLLNTHCFAVNTPLEAWGVTPFEAMSELSCLPTEDKEDLAARIPFEKLAGLRGEDLKRLLPSIRSLQDRIARIGVPAQHPFFGVIIDRVDRSIRLELEVSLASAIDALGKAEAAWDEVCRALQLELTGTSSNAPSLELCWERVRDALPHEGVDLKTDTWEKEAEAIRQVLAATRKFQALAQKHASAVKPEIWSEDLTEVETQYAKHSHKLLRGWIGEFTAARTKLKGLLQPTVPDKDKARREVLTDVIEAQKARAVVLDKQSVMTALFGAQWSGESTPPDPIGRLLDWVLGLREEVKEGALPPSILSAVSCPPPTHDLNSQVQAACEAAREAAERVQPVLVRLGFSLDASTVGFGRMKRRLEVWLSSLDRIDEYVEYSRVRDNLAQEGLGGVVELAEHWPLAGSRLTDLVSRSYWYGILDHAMRERPALKRFQREVQEKAIDEFCRLDNFKLEYNRALIRKAHQDRLPRFETAGGQLLLLRQQCELKRRQKSIRWIMTHAGEAVQRIKPVFMMSPLTVAIHLPPTMQPFDMVVFDEASQVKPEDALCAIARANQCLVVGDTRQMPPTNFFDAVADDGEEDSDEEEAASAAKHMESVLSLMNAATHQRARKPDLRWHYRSLDPRLIQPSNEIIYANRLIVFPCASSQLNGRRTGVYWHEVKGVYVPGSTKRCNEVEANAVCQAVVRNLKERPEESILVAAMNKQQADLIYFKLQDAERSQPDLFERHRTRHPFEPLDVKNLETVQGDERDVVLVSITYGPDETGVVHQRFGPINSEGGERRLNVLFTRARQRCEVFASLRSDQIKVAPNQSGVAAFKRYLQMAESGTTDIAVPTGRTVESPFEQQVLGELTQRGYEVHPQVGTDGYRIDLAVVDPDVPGRYILGVECDGAAYHSARSARDRDKLRQVVLERRGWTIHRIWSLDWWQDREGEMQRLVDRIEGLRAPDPIATKPVVEVVPPPVEVLDSTAPDPPTQPASRPYTATPPMSVHTEKEKSPGMSHEERMCAYVRRVAELEGPVHKSLLFVRVRDFLGASRIKASDRVFLDNSLRVWAKGLHSDGEAYWARPEQLATLRDWSTAPNECRKTEFIPSIELAKAICMAVEASIEISPDEIAAVAMRLLGFKRVTESMQSRVLQVVKELRKKGVLVPGANGGNVRGGVLRLAQPPRP